MEPGQKRVLEFHLAFGQPAPSRFTPLRDPKILELRARLILEEALEFCAAAGVRVYTSPDHCFRIRSIEDVELVQNATLMSDDPGVFDAAMADALGDIKYVADGAAVCMGLDLEPIELAIHRANMMKLGPDGKPIVRADGKCLKPEGWKPPDIAAVLFDQVKE